MNVPLNIDGIDVFLEGEGDQTIVMVHGWPDTWRLWDDQVAFLKNEYRCVRFTLPGFDISQSRRARSLDELVAFIAQVVNAISPEQPVIMMVHDWGCFFGYEYCMRHPDRVARIIGIDIGDAGSAEHMQSLNSKQKLGIFAYQAWLAIAWRIGGQAGDWMTRWMASKLKAKSNAEFIGAAMNYPYYIQWTGAHGSYRHKSVFKPQCPMLFIYGERKPFQFHSPQWVQRLSGRPGNHVVGLRTGHWVMRQDVPGFNAAITGWLKKAQ